MKRLVLVCLAMLSLSAMAERVEKVPFGDFETWTVRYIKESKLLGGNTRTLYVVAPTDTIRENAPYKYGRFGSPWSMSDAYAVVSGIHKAAGTVQPERRGNGYCARLDVKNLDVVVFKMLNIHVIVAGTIFWGQTIEPVTTAKDPYRNIDFGVPFTGRPKALEYDFKCKVSPDQWLTRASGLTAPRQVEGHDECETYLLLQRRWEDSEGRIHAERVGTAYERFGVSHPQWENDHRVPVWYGDCTHEPGYKPYMGLTHRMRALNSKGEIVPIEEDAWAPAGAKPTHAILMLTSGCYEAFYGKDGNSLWIDNVKLIYD